MQLTSPRAIISYEVTKTLVQAEARRRVSLELVARDTIREHLDKYYKDNFGTSFTRLSEIKLEIERLNEEADMLFESEFPNLEKLLREQAVAVTPPTDADVDAAASQGMEPIRAQGVFGVENKWINLIIPFVGMGADLVAPGSGAVIDIVNSLDMFLKSTSNFELLMSAVFMVMAIPAVGDALGLTAGPIFWLGKEVNKAKGLAGKAVARIMRWGPIKKIGQKVVEVITPLTKQFKPGGTVWEWVMKMWKALPVDKAGQYAARIQAKGGAPTMMSKMATALQRGIDAVRRMLGLAVQRASTAINTIISRQSVRNLSKFGVSATDDVAVVATRIARAEGATLKAMNSQVVGKAATEMTELTVKNAAGRTVTLTNPSGFGIRKFVTQTADDGTTQTFAVIAKVGRRGPEGVGQVGRSFRMTSGPDGEFVRRLGTVNTGLAGGRGTMVPIQNLSDDFVLAAGGQQLKNSVDDLAVIGTARTELTAAGTAVPAPAGVTATGRTATDTGRAAAPAGGGGTAAAPASGGSRASGGSSGGTAPAPTGGGSAPAPAGGAAPAGSGGRRVPKYGRGTAALGAGTATATGLSMNESVVRHRVRGAASYLDGNVSLADLLK
mgnify:CR=1 FL=1|tara:strand:- start:7406 stop:9235 length:1830 start_codon:yes stop_codon:yes gene_type:complete